MNPALVGRNPKGQPQSVRYEQINAMLLNEFLKEHRKGEAQLQDSRAGNHNRRAKIRNSEFGYNGKRASVAVADGQCTTPEQRPARASDRGESVTAICSIGTRHSETGIRSPGVRYSELLEKLD